MTGGQRWQLVGTADEPERQLVRFAEEVVAAVRTALG